MIGLVGRIARYARVDKGKQDFYVIPQNGERIFNYDSGNKYLDTISGIGIEDLYYDGTSAKGAGLQQSAKPCWNALNPQANRAGSGLCGPRDSTPGGYCRRFP